MGQLAEIHTGPGLPRGRGKLPPDEVARLQRDRIFRAIVGAVADRGYADVRVADVVDRARVSRQTFYALFADKHECFLAAHAAGLERILTNLAAWAGAVGPTGDDSGADAREQLRGAIGAYLALAADEPEFAYCMLVELPAISADGLGARLAAHAQIASMLEGWHSGARKANPGWPAVPDSRYGAAVGAVHDLLFAAVATGRSDLVALAPEAVDAVSALLEIPSVLDQLTDRA